MELVNRFITEEEKRNILSTAVCRYLAETQYYGSNIRHPMWYTVMTTAEMGIRFLHSTSTHSLFGLSPSLFSVIKAFSSPLSCLPHLSTHSLSTSYEFQISMHGFFSENSKIMIKLSLWQAAETIRLWDVEDPTFCRQSAHRYRWGCQL
jgi:hypothetical protein